MPVPRSVFEQVQQFEAQGYSPSDILDGLERSNKYADLGRQVRLFRTQGRTDDEILAGLKASYTPEPPGWLERAGQAVIGRSLVGAGETAASLLTSLYGLPASGLAGLAAMPFGGLEGAQKAIEAMQRALIYQPQTERGQQIAEKVFYPFELLHRAGGAVGEKTLEATGSPALATAAATATEAGPLFALPWLKGRIAPKAPRPAWEAPAGATEYAGPGAGPHAQRVSVADLYGMRSRAPEAPVMEGEVVGQTFGPRIAPPAEALPPPRPELPAPEVVYPEPLAQINLPALYAKGGELRARSLRTDEGRYLPKAPQEGRLALEGPEVGEAAGRGYLQLPEKTGPEAGRQEFRLIPEKTPTRQPTADFKQLYRQAKESLPEFEQLSQGIAQETGGELVLRPGGVKSLQRAFEKGVREKYGEHDKVTDLLASTIVFETLEQAAAAFRAVKGMPETVIARDRFSVPMKSGYRDYIVLLKLPKSGLLAEMQITTKPLYLAKEKFGGHKLYEIQRRLEGGVNTPENKRKLDAVIAAQRELYEMAANARSAASFIEGLRSSGRSVDLYNMLNAAPGSVISPLRLPEVSSTRKTLPAESTAYRSNSDSTTIGVGSPNAETTSFVEKAISTTSEPTIAQPAAGINRIRGPEAFSPAPGAVEIPLDRIVPREAPDAAKLSRAEALIDKALAGTGPKRRPVFLHENADGTLTPIDGNTTVHALRARGADSVLGVVVSSSAKRPAAEFARAREAAAPKPPPERPALPESFAEDIPREVAVRAYERISHSPEQRARESIDSYTRHLEKFRERLADEAKTPEAALEAERLFAEYRQGYRDRTLKLLEMQSKIASPGIVGPARFPAARMRKLETALIKESKAVEGWVKREQRKILDRLEELQPAPEPAPEPARTRTTRRKPAPIEEPQPPQAQEPAPPPAAKQPWEMTRREWIDEWDKNRAETFDTRNKRSGAAASIARIQRGEFLNYGLKGEKTAVGYERPDHRQIVEKALREGKPVPQEVLRDYPDLLKPKEPVIERPAARREPAIDRAAAKREKDYLIAEIDRAIKEVEQQGVRSKAELLDPGDDPLRAPAWARELWWDDPQAQRMGALRENIKNFGVLEIKAPSGAVFNIVRHPESLRKARDLIAKHYPVAETSYEPFKTPSIRGGGHPLKTGFDGWAYMEGFQPRKVKELPGIEAPKGANPPPLFYEQTPDGVIFTQGHYAVKLPPGEKVPAGSEPPQGKIDLGRFLKRWKATDPLDYVGEVYVGIGPDPKAPTWVHLAGRKAGRYLLDSDYVNAVLTRHPEAKPFAEPRSEVVVFRVGREPVAVIARVKPGKEGISGQAMERMAQAEKRRDITVKDILDNEQGFLDLGPVFEAVGRGLKRAYAAAEEFFDPFIRLPKKERYLEERYKTFGSIARVERIVERVFERTRKLDEATRQGIFRYLDGKPVSLPPEAQRLADTLRAVNNLVGEALVRRGLLSREAFEAHKNQYVRYLYLKHVLGDKFDLGGRAGKLDLSYIKRRKDLTDEQRRAIGLIEDVSIAEPYGLSKSLTDIAKHDFYEKIASNPEWVWEPSVIEAGDVRVFRDIASAYRMKSRLARQQQNVQVEPNPSGPGYILRHDGGPLDGEPLRFKMGIEAAKKDLEAQRRIAREVQTPEVMERLDRLERAIELAEREAGKATADFVALPDAPAYGPLRGAYVRKEIARDIAPFLGRLNDEIHGSRIMNKVLDTFEAGMTAFKVSKTALNVPTAARNIYSNFVQLNMSGIPWYDVPRYMVRAAEEMRSKGRYYQEGFRNGLFKTNWTEAEIGEVLATFRQMEGGALETVIGKMKDLAKYYGKIDDFFKLAKFIEQREAGVPIGKAVIQAQKWGMDYSIAHPSIKMARRFVSPFVSYTYKITPLILEALRRRPWVVAKYALAPYAMFELARATLDLTEEDFQRLRRMLPSYVKGNPTYAVLPWKSPEGNLQWVNIGYFFPWASHYELARALKEGDTREMTQLIGNPYLDILWSLKSGTDRDPPRDSFTGQPIYNELDDPTDKALKLAEWLYNKWAPTMLTRQGALGYTARAITGDKDRYGRQTTTEQAAARWVGVNIVAPTPMQAAIEKRAQVAQLKSEMMRALRDPNLDWRKKEAIIRNFAGKLRELGE